MFYINDNIFACSHVSTRMLINTCMLHTITGLPLAIFIAPVELLNASYEKGANLKVTIGA